MQGVLLPRGAHACTRASITRGKVMNDLKNRIEVCPSGATYWDVYTFKNDHCVRTDHAYSRDNALGKADILAETQTFAPHKLPVVVKDIIGKKKEATDAE